MEYFRHFVSPQSVMIRLLIETIYFNLAKVKEEGPILGFTNSGLKLRYTIGGEQFASRAEGAATVGQPAQRLPILSFTGWFKGQTWNAFLQETITIMLGQLTKSLDVQRGGESVQDQEDFVVGFHGFYFHITRAFFAGALISRVHANGCSENEVFNIQFTRGYNLCLKEDWLEATRALSRLLRYLISGKAKVSAVRTCLSRASDTS